MTETKLTEPNTFPETAGDPGQTQLLPPQTAPGKQDFGKSLDRDGDGGRSLSDESRPKFTPLDWFRKLTPAAIIRISFSIILIFVVLFFLLITQTRQKNKNFKPLPDESLAQTGEMGTSGNRRGTEKKIMGPVAKPLFLLTDDGLAGQAPMAVRSAGAVVSAALDPELAAMVDALKIRLKISVESKSTSRGNMIIRTTKGDFRGFKINVEEKLDKQHVISEEITVNTPKKGFIKTINQVLESIRDSDPARFTLELQNAGLEIGKLPLQPGSRIFRVQFKALGVFGKPVAADLLISGKSLGKISLGMPTAVLETMLLSSYVVLKRKVLVNDMYYDVYKVLDQSNEPLFFVYENKGRVWGIAIISEIFRTAGGIGINSSLGDIRLNYPRLTIGISEKNIPFIKIDGVDGLFVIQNEGFDIARRVFPNKNKVISILIGNSLEFE